MSTRKAANFYPTLHFRDRRGAVSIRYRNRAKISSYVWTQALFGIVFAPVQKLSGPGGGGTRFPKPLPYLWPKSAIFPTLFMTYKAAGGEEGKARMGGGDMIRK